MFIIYRQHVKTHRYMPVIKSVMGFHHQCHTVFFSKKVKLNTSIYVANVKTMESGMAKYSIRHVAGVQVDQNS